MIPVTNLALPAVKVLLLTMTVLTGCGNGTGASADQSPDPSTNPGGESVTDPSVPNGVQPQANLDGTLPDNSQPGDTAGGSPDQVLLLPPLNLRASRYSTTAGELFWDSPVEGEMVVSYDVQLDGRLLDTVPTHSYFLDTLQMATMYDLAVFSVDASGRRSTAASIVLSADIDIPPADYRFELALDRTRAVLDEGNTEGSRFEILVYPQGNELIELTVQAQQAGDGDNVIVELGRQTLHRMDPRTSVTFRFPIGMRPIFPQERRFNLVASSGSEVRTLEIILDVKPTNAPDVYLLIGQSNMVGNSESGVKDVSPGGPDERHERIWQLNVSPNDQAVFGGFDDFLDESSTAIEPRFIQAEDPLHDPRNTVVDYKGGTFVGLGLSFAKAALDDTTQRIYLVPAAWGATGFCKGMGDLLAWNAGSSNNVSLGGTALLERALTRLRITQRDTGGVLRGILWHQGGADANSQACADSYSSNLQLMVERLRREAVVDPRGVEARGSRAAVPFIVATQSRGKDGRGDYSRWSSTRDQVDAVHRNIASLVPHADWVNNDDLVPPAYPCGSSSCVHFGAAANREIGRRYHQALKRIWSR